MREGGRGPHGLLEAARSPALLHDVRPQAQGAGPPDRLRGLMRPLPAIDASLHRSLREIESAQGPTVILDGNEVVLLCSNDYLGLAGHPELRDAAAEAAQKWGAGAGASQLVSGHMTIHRELEERLAEVQGHEGGGPFAGGFLAQTGGVPGPA